MIITAADIKKLREKGYDGIRWDFGKSTELSVFSPEQIKNVSNETPTDDPDIRFSAEDEDGGEWDKELARMPQSVQEAVRRVKGSRGGSMREFPNLDAYLSDKGARLAAEKAERLRDKGKDEFKGTEALEKLGVKIENSAGDYSNVEQLKMTGERLFGTDEDAGNDKFNVAAAAEDTMYNISNDVPYVRNVSGLLGVGDQTLPMPDLYGTAKGIGGAFADAAEGDMRSFSEEIARQLMGLAGDTLPGGRQAEKTAQGIEAVARGGSYKGSGDNKRLQYPVESPLEDPWTALRAAIFGKNAIPESRTYWAAGGKALSAAQTRLYEDLVDSGLSRKRAYEILKRFNDATADLEADRDKNGNPIGGSKKEKIVKEINKLPLSRKQKNMLYISRGYSEKDLNSLPWN